MQTLESPITYYGGKKSFLPTILPMITKHDVYTELYFGGGSVFWAKDPAKNETINDRLDIVINFYKVLKSNYTHLKQLIDESLISRTTHKYSLSIIQNADKYDNISKAWAFWYCCNFSFANKIGGGIKYSNDRGSIVPRVLQNKKRDFTEQLVYRIENVQIENDDAVKIFKSRNVPAAFHYIDPPYIGSDMGHYKGFKEKDLIDLLEILGTCKGNFLLSNYNSEVLTNYINKNNWNKIEVVKHLSAPMKNSGRKKTEVLVFNYKLPGEQSSLILK